MIFTINANVFDFDFERVRPRGGWMGLHFHNWTDYNKVTFLACFSRVTRMGSQIFGIFGISRDLKIGRFAIEKRFLLLF